MSQELDHLKAAVAANHDAVASAVAAFKGLAAEIRANKDDPAALEALATEVEQDAAGLGQAVVANTPQQPAPPTP